MSDVEETDAVNRLKRGDIHGLELLVYRYQHSAFGVAFHICGDVHTAQDVVADAFLAVFDRIDTYDPQRPFVPWFYRIVTNTARAAIRRERRLVHDEAGRLLEVPSPPHENPERIGLGHMLGDAIATALQALPDGERAALVLRLYMDMDERTIAATLGIPVGTVKWRLFRARRRMRASLRPWCESDLALQEGGTHV